MLLFINILYCRIADNIVSIRLMDYFSSGLSIGDICVHIQTNPYHNNNEDIDKCLFINWLGLKHKETLDIQLTASVFCSAVAGDVLHFYRDEKHDIINQQRVTGTGGMSFNYNPLCIDFQMNLSAECKGFMEVSPDIDMLSLFDNNELQPSQCPHNSMSHEKQRANVISIVPPLALTHVRYSFRTDLYNGGLQSHLHDAALGNGFIKVVLGFAGSCPVNCRQVLLSVAYKDYTGNTSQVVVLKWNLYFGRYDTWKYSFFRIPFDNFFVYTMQGLNPTHNVITRSVFWAVFFLWFALGRQVRGSPCGVGDASLMVGTGQRCSIGPGTVTVSGDITVESGAILDVEPETAIECEHFVVEPGGKVLADGVSDTEDTGQTLNGAGGGWRYVNTKYSQNNR